MSNSLTPLESKRLAHLEKTIKRGQKTFVEVWAALAEIKLKKLYRKGFETFEDYCQTKWDFSRQYANQIIAGLIAVKSLPPNLETIVSNPGQAKALSKVPPPKRVEVLEVVKSAGPITAKAITTTAARLSAPPPPRKSSVPAPPVKKKVPKDETGVEIPDDLIPLWQRGSEVNELLASISAVRCALKAAHEKGDSLYAEIDGKNGGGLQSLIINFNSAYEELKRAVPYAVCPDCNGKLTKGCSICLERGFVSEWFWRTCIPEEKRKLRYA